MTSSPAPQYFFIIGAMKAGTTSLFKYLADHPQLCPSIRKEPRVFRDAGDPAAQMKMLKALFPGRTNEPWCFEGSTAYTKYPRYKGVPARLRAALPDARFIYMVRNPIERTWSHYLHNLAHGRESLAFSQAMETKPQYLDFSRYHLQLQQYHEVFPKERVLVLVFEEMIADPTATVRSICEFLGIDTSYRPPTREVVYNASSDKRAASGPLRTLRRFGLVESLPWRVRQHLRVSGEPLPRKSAILTPVLRAAIADTLRADVEAFFGSFGRRIHAWSDFA